MSATKGVSKTQNNIKDKMNLKRWTIDNIEQTTQYSRVSIMDYTSASKLV